MRTLLLIVSCLCFFQTARGQDGPRAIVEKAIRAHGGFANLAKLRAGQTKWRGSIELPNERISFTKEEFFWLPDKVKEVQEIEVRGRKTAYVMGFNAGRGWVEINGKPQALEDQMRVELKEAGHLLQILHLLPLEEKSHQLQLLASSQIHGEPLVCLKVSCKGYRDIRLYFSQESGLLIKTERTVYDFLNKKEVREERNFGNFREIDGLKVAGHLVVDQAGKKLMECDLVEARFVDRLDDSTFAVPVQKLDDRRDK